MRDRTQINRRPSAVVAAAVVGAGLLWLTHNVFLPALARKLTIAQRRWLRDVFAIHPAWFLFGLVVLVAIVALPLLFVAVKAAGISGREVLGRRGGRTS